MVFTSGMKDIGIFFYLVVIVGFARLTGSWEIVVVNVPGNAKKLIRIFM